MTSPISVTLTANAARGISVQLAMVLIVGGVIALSRRYFDLHMGVPGHTGILWMFLLIYGRGLTDRRGTGILIGVSTAFWGEAVGLKHTLVYNLLLYTSVGTVIDVMATIPGLRLSHPLGGLVAGATSHAAKYGFIVVHAKALALPKKFLLVGLLKAFGYHLVFGAVGGVAAGLLLWMLLRSSRSQERKGLSRPQGMKQ